MTGIENIKESLQAIIYFAEDVNFIIDDGKASFFETITLLSGTADFLKVVNNWEDLKDEYKSLEKEEREDLIKHFEEELDIDAIKAESIIDDAFQVIITLDRLVQRVSLN